MVAISRQRPINDLYLVLLLASDVLARKIWWIDKPEAAAFRKSPGGESRMDYPINCDDNITYRARNVNRFAHL